MRPAGDIWKRTFKPTAILFPASLLALTPIFDIVLAITGNSRWNQAAFWCAFVGVSMAMVLFMPLFIDWLALTHGTPARRALLPSLLLHTLGIGAFVASVALRLRARGGLSPLAFICAESGVILFALAALNGAARERPLATHHTPAAQM
jgi:uncharacterized membrane protein